MGAIPTSIAALLVAVGAAGCGADTNLLGLTVPREHKYTFEALLDLGRAAYDANDLEKALEYSSRAYALDPKSERAAVLYGFVNLSLAGGDPFSLASAMMANNKKDDEAAGALALTGSGTADTLAALKEVLGITDQEMEQMATKDIADPELPILIPGCVEDARSAVDRLARINEAVNAVCRFTDTEARVVSDYRHGCGSTDEPRTQRHQAHFLWAFAHLTEALAFNSILTYATADPEGKKTNLELRVAKLRAQDTSTPEAVTAFLAAVSTVSATLDAVLPVSGACSETAPTTQLRATLNDMLAVDAAFQRMPSVPDKITKGIRKAIAKIKSVQDGASNVTAQTQALKGDFTKKLSGELAAKIDELGANPDLPLPEEQRAELCATFAAISTDPTQSVVCAGGGAPDL